ncbi:vitellogenin-2-like [Heteronotia binoei]|uniref:vitellogenin-2-like n=1 Tax=Heteronotia binoei TaxID=13085 RepID=UPI00292D7C92|nr:vitellogenin-2-like [Heteronotia binoei]
MVKIQVVLSRISEPNKPIAFMEGALLNPYKVVAFWKNVEKSQYKIKALAEIGWFDHRPALQMKVEYTKVPHEIKKKISCVFLKMLNMLGISLEEKRNPYDQIKMITVARTSEKYDVILKTSRTTTIFPNVQFPWSFSEDRLNPVEQQLSFLDLIIGRTHKGICSVYRNNLTTFAGAEIQTLLVPNCPLILAKNRYKQFSVMMMQRSTHDITKDLIFASNGPEIKLSVKEGAYQVEVDHVEVPLSSLPYRFEGHGLTIAITEKNGQLVLKAYDELTCYYDGHNITIEVDSNTMQEQLQGLCGQFDGEKEFQTPSGRIAKNALGFVQSWVHTEGPCDGDCNLRYSHVKPEHTIEYLGQQSECFSVESVLQCKEGCLPTATVSIPVAMHCLPAGSTTNLLDTRARLDQKSEDLVHSVKVHTLCSCKNRRCAS